jgi:hypothetical protein
LWYWARRPVEHHAVRVVLAVAVGARIERVVDGQREVAHPLGLRGVHVVAAHELGNRRVAHVAAMLHSAEQIVEHAVPQGAVGHAQYLDAELVQRRPEDRHAAGQHRCAIGAQAGDALGVGPLVLDEQAPQAIQALARDPVFGEGVFAQDVLHRARGARGADGLLPARVAVRAHDAGELLARRQLRALHAPLVDPAFGEVLQAVAHAAHVQRLGELRLEAFADDELRGTAADVDHQAPMRRGRQRMRDPEVDEPRLLASRDHLDREAEYLARLAQELRCVLRHAQRVGADGAHRLARQAAQAFAELAQRLERARLAGAVQALFRGQAGAQSHDLAQRVERVDLTVDHASDLQVKAVRSEVDCR